MLFRHLQIIKDRMKIFKGTANPITAILMVGVKVDYFDEVDYFGNQDCDTTTIEACVLEEFTRMLSETVYVNGLTLNYNFLPTLLGSNTFTTHDQYPSTINDYYLRPKVDELNKKLETAIQENEGHLYDVPNVQSVRIEYLLCQPDYVYLC